MGLVQQEQVGQSRGKMPLPRPPIETWERHLAAILSSIAPGRRSGNIDSSPGKHSTSIAFGNLRI